jgi:anti-sigma B factor antagonist
MEPPHPPLSLRRADVAPLPPEQDVVVVRLREQRDGVDPETAPTLRVSLDHAIEIGAGLIVIDLTGVTFVDSTMLGELLGATRQVRLNGAPARIVVDDPHVRRILELTLLDRVLGLYPSFELAVDGGNTSV